MKRLTPARDERLGVALEQVAVGRQRELVQAAGSRRSIATSARQLAAHERLAAGQAHVADAHLDEHAHQPLDLLEAQQLARARATACPSAGMQ